MKKLTILVDMDDVLENLVECWVDELNKKCGSSLCEEDITDWRIAKFFPSLTNEDLFSPLNTADGMVRVETWDEIYEVVSEFAGMLSDEDEIDQVLKGVDVESA